MEVNSQNNKAIEIGYAYVEMDSPYVRITLTNKKKAYSYQLFSD